VADGYPPVFHKKGFEPLKIMPFCDADLWLIGVAHVLCRPRILFVDRRGIAGSGGRGAPGMVSKFVYYRFRYVPKNSCWDCRGHWGNGGGARRSVVLVEHGLGFTVNAQLYSAFCVDRLGIFAGLVASASFRARFAPAFNRFDRESAEKLIA
jgi:hypothetical protein